MTDPVIVKRPGVAPVVEQWAAVAIVLGPLLVIAHFWRRDMEIHLRNPAWNLAIHAMLLVVPMVWAYLIGRTALPLKRSEDQVWVATNRYVDTLRDRWWGSLLYWPAALVGVGGVIYNLATRDLPRPEALSTPPGTALVIVGITLIVSLWYRTIVGERTEYWLTDAGIRSGLFRLYEWERIPLVLKQGTRYQLFHQAQPKVAMTSFRIGTPEQREAFETALHDHGVSLAEGWRNAPVAAKVAVVVAFWANVAMTLWLWRGVGVGLHWSVLVSLFLGMALILVLEQYRGISKLTRLKAMIAPVVEPE